MSISIDRVRRGRSTRQRARAGLGWALAALLLATAGPVWAEDPKQEAKARYTTGQSHYNLNEFKEALQDFKEAYRLFPDPVFLFNVAQCERQLGQPLAAAPSKARAGELPRSAADSARRRFPFCYVGESL